VSFIIARTPHALYFYIFTLTVSVFCQKALRRERIALLVGGLTFQINAFTGDGKTNIRLTIAARYALNGDLITRFIV